MLVPNILAASYILNSIIQWLGNELNWASMARRSAGALLVSLSCAWLGVGAADTLLDCILPCSLVWWGMMLLIFGAVRLKSWSLVTIVVVVAIVYTAAGNARVANWLMQHLESQYYDQDLSRLTGFDAVIVLGGGVGPGPFGIGQIESSSGDRLLLGARLYKQGKTKFLITSGSNFSKADKSKSPADLTSDIWTSLGVPREHTFTLPGRTTRDEIDSLFQLVNEHGWTRVGLVTSAWHLPRALELAKARGVSTTPIPAGFLSTRSAIPMAILPNPQALFRTQVAVKEYILCVR